MTAEIQQRNARQKEKGHARNKKLFGRIGLAESDKRDGDIAVSEDEDVFGRRVKDEGRPSISTAATSRHSETNSKRTTSISKTSKAPKAAKI